MIGLTFDKILVLLLLAAFVIGPTRLPAAAAQLGRLVRSVKHAFEGAKTSLRDTGGPDLDEIDWAKLDPRQYDPRRIIRDALADSSDKRTARPGLEPTETEAADAGTPRPVRSSRSEAT